MLLLVTLALVLASAVLLVLGFVQDALGFIYLSMVCAGVAALALFVFARLARRRGAALAGAGIAASPYREGPSQDDTPAAQRSTGAEPTRGMGPAGRGRRRPAEEPAYVQEPAYAEDPDYADELEYEDVEAEDDGGFDEDVAYDEPETEAVAYGRGAVASEYEADEWAAEAEDEEDWGDEVVFPIEDYDDLRVAEILPLLGQLDPDELQEVRDRELAGKARATVLDRIDDRLGRIAGPPPAAVTTASIPVVQPDATDEPEVPETPAASAAPGRRAGAARKAAGTAAKAAGTAAKKVPATRKAATRKAPAKRTAAPVDPAPAEATGPNGITGQAAPVDVPDRAPAAQATPAPRRAATRKVAAAATEPTTPSATARRTAAARKAADPTQPGPGPAELAELAKPAGRPAPRKAARPASARKAVAETAGEDDPARPVGPAKRAPRKPAE